MPRPDDLHVGGRSAAVVVGDDKRVGIEVFGIGEALTNYETFVRLANPETIKALLSERDSLLAALKAVDHMCLVISSAVRHSDSDENYRATSDALKLVRAALTTKEG